VQEFLSLKSSGPVIGRRGVLLQGLAIGSLLGSRLTFARKTLMKRETCIVQAKVLNHWIIQKFAGDAIVASPQPRFVVALLLTGTKMPFQVESTNVTFTTHRVAFFAISSIVKVFAETDVVGKEYRLAIEQREIDGKISYGIGVAD
jgi:hypothetical protein